MFSFLPLSVKVAPSSLVQVVLISSSLSASVKVTLVVQGPCLLCVLPISALVHQYVGITLNLSKSIISVTTIENQP